MDSTANVTWNHKLWDVITLLYCTPRFVGMGSITEDKCPADFKALTSLTGDGYRLYARNRKIDEALRYLNGQEEVLNSFFNIAFAIAPDEVLSRLLCAPLGIPDAGPFTSFGSGEIASRYTFGNGNVTQPDGFFSTSKSLVAAELKLGSACWPEQIAKYVALMRWEQKETGLRENLGLLFILPEKSLESNWSKVGLNVLNRRGDHPAQSSMIRRCPADFFDNLNQRKLPARVRQLFDNESGHIRSDFERLRLAAVSWTWLRYEISKIEGELDCSVRGDQTLKRLLAGLRAQIEAHRNTGIVEAASAAP
jgi:hypothetical protein